MLLSSWASVSAKLESTRVDTCRISTFGFLEQLQGLIEGEHCAVERVILLFEIAGVLRKLRLDGAFLLFGLGEFLALALEVSL